MKRTAWLLALVMLMASLAGTVGFADSQYHEAPMLAERVKAGELPPVEERLPEEPVVVDKDYFAQGTMDEWNVGNYGGEMTVLHNEANNAPDVFFMVMQPITRLPNTLSDEDVRDNICHFLGANEENTEFTFSIRKGLKWSDGEPVTTEDVRFAFEDITLNTEIYPTPLSWCTDGRGVAGKLTIVDDNTFKFTFEIKNSAFLMKVTLNNWIEYSRIIKPAHYLKQFHKAYADPDALAAACVEAGYAEDQWVNLMLDKDADDREITSRNSLGQPTLTPFVLKSITDEVYVYERNPYYFKVDCEGNQLPYLDRIVSPKVQDGQMENMYMISGKADILRRNAVLLNLPLYKENEAMGGYTTYIRESHLSCPSTLHLNYDYGSEAMQEVVANKDFRLAVSHGIDRQEIIDIVYLGMGEIPDNIPANFDPELANSLLDGMGMSVGTDGWRTCPDGSEFTLILESGNEAVDLTPAIEIAAAHLRNNLKINCTIKGNDATLFAQSWAAGDVQCRNIWAFDMMASDERTTRWMTNAWKTWHANVVAGNDPEANGGIEPLEWAKAGWDIEAELAQAMYGTEEYEAALQKAKDFYYDNIPSIPLIQRSKLPIPISNRIGNVQSGGYQITILMSAEQLYVK